MGLNLVQLIKEHPITNDPYPNDPVKNLDRIAFIVDILCRQHLKKVRQQHGLTHRKKSLCAQLIQAIIYPYKRYLTWLEEAGVMHLVEPGRMGKTCGKFVFFERYQVNQYTFHKISDARFLRTIYRQSQQKGTILKYQAQYAHLLQLRVDWEEAGGILDSLYPKGDEIGRRMQIKLLQRIDDPSMAIFKMGKTGRLTTTITNIRKELRDALRHQGRRLAGCDIKSSIPFFALSLFDKATFSKLNIQGLILEINPNITLTTSHTTHDPLTHAVMLVNEKYMLVKIQENPQAYPDYLHFKDMLLNNDIYQFVADYWNEGLQKNYNRNSAKKKLLQVFNEPPSRPSREKNALKLLWPSLIMAVDQLNKDFRTTANGTVVYKREGGKKDGILIKETVGKRVAGDPVCLYAHLTQRIEANVILDKVCGYIARYKPGIAFLTIHDSVMTTREHAEEVKQIMETIIEQETGLRPTVNIEWTWRREAKNVLPKVPNRA